ncbi:MAG: hypothetical protein KJZ53_04155 [Anaerolineales bacterium]|nr:hypothetical protein [Anaerolineales bacterium]MCL4257708.1 hypothetical protein [Anaerolineales bacterium]
MRFNSNLGFLLLGIWLILIGLGQFVSLGNLGALTNVLALISGILIVMGR